jgi:hypothetical protein
LIVAPLCDSLREQLIDGLFPPPINPPRQEDERVLAKRLALTVAVGIFLVALPGESFAQYCVRYARSLTDIEIRGNAWTWWNNAAGAYQRGSTPAEGAVLVFRRGPAGMRLGHVSAVTGIVDARTILVTHSFGGATLWRDVPIVDVSPDNDWTRVRVWHGPSRRMGGTEFATYGFVYPHGAEPEASLAAVGADEALATPASLARNPRRVGIDWEFLASVPLPERRPGASADGAGARATETAEAWEDEDREYRVSAGDEPREWRSARD